ncbi:MAG TPA: hypothetical protein VNO82_10515, partial [Solirubrobacteraceae bacterium]|nr:hypothetical protein [Solirubrobacteraceae bacterium]
MWIVAVLVLVGLVDVAPASAQTPPVGTVREWVGLDDFNGTLYRKDYTLRAVGQKVEVWVANDRTFPAGDCRNLPVSTDVTDAQVSTLTTEFDGTIYPTETAVFGTPPDRDGSNAQLAGDFTGDGDKTVLLLDNVRDENFYDRFVPTVIPGFFSAQYNELLDRNVVTIDVFDWTHRSGAGPPDEPTADPCTSRPARPYEKEAELARRWQALGHYYTDPFEGNWIGQGMSELAAALTGYVDPTASVPISCFTGFGVDCGGPENSLNLWNEGDPDADVGHASALMLFLHDRYGDDFITRLHQDGLEQGLEGLDAALEAEGVADMYGVLHDFRTMLLVDGIVGESPAGSMTGIARDRVTTPSLRSTVDLANPDAYDRVPGAPPNGADFVPLAAPGPRLESVTFEGAETLPTHPLRWTSISNDPDRPGNAVLWSRDGNDIDEMAVIEVTVPVGDPTLRLAAKYGAELGYDYGYVMVSTDGGATYAPVAGNNTVDGPLGPSLNGSTDGFEPHTFGLTAYAGQSILLGFRYISDGGVNEGGILLDDVTVGATQLSDGTNI